MKKSRSTRSHFTHARSCSRALNQVPTSAKQLASIRTYSLWKGDIFPFDRFTGYKKSNQNQFGRVLPFAFALTYDKIYLFFSSLADFDSFSWRVHLSYGVCRLRARVQRKTRAPIRRAVKRADPSKKVWCSRLGSTKTNRLTLELRFLKNLDETPFYVKQQLLGGVSCS